MKKNAIEHGQSFPIGPTVYDYGVNFCLFAKNASLVELLLFDSIDDVNPAQVITLDPKKNRTYHYWHIFITGIKHGQLYGYRVHGPFEPLQGHRYNASKLVLDPYAKLVAVPKAYNREDAATNGKPGTPSMKSIVADLSAYNWEHDEHPKQPFAKTIIYEMHVGGFTMNPNSGLSAEKRGTYAGLVEKIPYLVELGITAVELLPVFQFDEQDCPNGGKNYWGYSPVSFFAAHQGYCSGNNTTDVLDEFRDMVKALHRAGIEVILDVVFNHTAEGNEAGPTFSYRGIDNSIYYILEKNKSFYSNYSGTGNTLNANHPIVRRMIIDSLRFWVSEMHVDGFRFDLASILARDESGNPIENPPVLWDIESEPVLAGTKLIAEAWDAAGLYQVGSFVGDSWKEWNGRFRDEVRSFVKGDNGVLSKFVSKLLGSPDIYGHKDREAEQSINFVTCHDGFTLNDLVSYNAKRNEANGEDNLDGNNDNLSWSFGVEGHTNAPVIEAMRNRQVKNFFTYLLIAMGVPMIWMGDEVRRTQKGNNNAYCQDNELSWFNWDDIITHSDILRLVKILIRIRLQRDHTKDEYNMSLNQLLSRSIIKWHGTKINQPDWSADSHSIACTIQSLSGEFSLHYMFNAFSSSLEFEVPNKIANSFNNWKRWIDTSLPSPNDIGHWHTAAAYESHSYFVQPYSVVILISKEKA